MDVQALLEPLRKGPAPDVKLVRARLAARRRRRRALLTGTGCVAVAAIVGAIAWLAPRDTASVATVGDPTVDATTQIRQAVETLFLSGPSVEEKLAQIDDPTGLEPAVAGGMQDDRAHRLTLVITGIDINDPVAIAHIDFSLDDVNAMTDGQLEFTNAGDRWLATRDSYCALIATGGLQCPTAGAATNFDSTTVITTHVDPSINEKQQSSAGSSG